MGEILFKRVAFNAKVWGNFWRVNASIPVRSKVFDRKFKKF